MKKKKMNMHHLRTNMFKWFLHQEPLHTIINGVHHDFRLMMRIMKLKLYV